MAHTAHYRIGKGTPNKADAVKADLVGFIV